jgi:hypothetical protein
LIQDRALEACFQDDFIEEIIICNITKDKKMKINKGFIREVAKSNACLPSKTQKRNAARQTAVVLMSCGLILGLLPGFATV